MENQPVKNPGKHNVHKVLAHSYSVYFVLFLVGVALDLIFNLKVFDTILGWSLGLIFLIVGTLLIFWAQRTSRNLSKENLSHHSFRQGPYRYARTPTHWGLLLIMLGFGLITSSLFVIIFAFISFIITKFTFLDKQEKILEAKYGTHYQEYKKSVKF